MVGVNESGKTNLLLPLWKLKPARDGAIDLIADAPRKRFTEIRANPKGFIFIEADFELSDKAAAEIASVANADPEDVRFVRAMRGFDGATYILFTNAPSTKTVETSYVREMFESAKQDIKSTGPSGKGDEVFQAQAIEAIDGALGSARAEETQDKESISKVVAAL